MASSVSTEAKDSD